MTFKLLFRLSLFFLFFYYFFCFKTFSLTYCCCCLLMKSFCWFLREKNFSVILSHVNYKATPLWKSMKISKWFQRACLTRNKNKAVGENNLFTESNLIAHISKPQNFMQYRIYNRQNITLKTRLIPIDVDLTRLVNKKLRNICGNSTGIKMKGWSTHQFSHHVYKS